MPHVQRALKKPLLVCTENKEGNTTISTDSTFFLKFCHDSHGINLVLSGEVDFDTRLMCEGANPHPYFCVEMRRNEASSVDFTIPISGGILKVCNRFNCQGNNASTSSDRVLPFFWNL